MAALLALANVGCAALMYSGVSVEAGVGSSNVSYSRAETAPGSAFHWTIALSLETDWARSSWMGAGAEYRSRTFEGRDTVSGWAARYAIGTLLDLPRTDWLRPRTGLSLTLGDSSSKAPHSELAWNFGASLHAPGGFALHLLGGPHVMTAVSQDEALVGVGWQLRVRILKHFFANCDRAIEVIGNMNMRAEDACR